MIARRRRWSNSVLAHIGSSAQNISNSTGCILTELSEIIFTLTSTTLINLENTQMATTASFVDTELKSSVVVDEHHPQQVHAFAKNLNINLWSQPCLFISKTSHEPQDMSSCSACYDWLWGDTVAFYCSHADIYTALLLFLYVHVSPRTSLILIVDSNFSCCAPSRLSSPRPVLISHFHLLFISFFIWAPPLRLHPTNTSDADAFPRVHPQSHQTQLQHTLICVCVCEIIWKLTACLCSETTAAFKTRPRPQSSQSDREETTSSFQNPCGLKKHRTNAHRWQRDWTKTKESLSLELLSSWKTQQGVIKIYFHTFHMTNKDILD